MKRNVMEETRENGRITALKKESEKYEKLRKEAEDMLLKNSFGGTLQVRKRKDEKRTPLFYKRTDLEGRAEEQYIRPEDLEKEKGLIEKYCAKKVLTVLRSMEKKKQVVYPLFLPERLQEVYEELYAVFGQLTPPRYVPNSQLMEQWEKGNPEPAFRKEELIYRTQRGEMVRSKFEKLIADTLFSEKIPYQYERELDLSGKGIYPDFTIVDPRNGRILYIEALGMMDDPNYVSGNLKKIRLYEKNSIFTGDRLILIFDSREAPFDSELFRLQLRRMFSEK